MDLRSFFQPRSIALIGASADPQSISARPLRMLAQHGFRGDLYPINPKYTELTGRPVYPSVGAVPGRVDLALVAVPAPLVPGTLEECAAAGVQHALVLSSGFGESGPEGQRLQQAIADIGGVGFGILNRGREQGLPAGFAGVVSTGNEVDLDWLDYVDYWLDQAN